jgi:hypothetical protein
MKLFLKKLFIDSKLNFDFLIPKTFPPNCLSPTLHVLSQDNINTILTRQNTLRNSAASGNLRGFNNVLLPSANRMARTQWSNQLANFAVDSVRRCVFSHDNCRSSCTCLIY